MFRKCFFLTLLLLTTGCHLNHAELLRGEPDQRITMNRDTFCVYESFKRIAKDTQPSIGSTLWIGDWDFGLRRGEVYISGSERRVPLSFLIYDNGDTTVLEERHQPDWYPILQEDIAETLMAHKFLNCPDYRR